MRVGLFTPTFDGRVCSALADWAADELAASRYLFGRLVSVAHLPLHISRPKIFAELEHLDALVTIDSDQAPVLLPRVEVGELAGVPMWIERSGGSVIDACVRQYLEGVPDRILVGVTRGGDGLPNVKRDPDGRIVEAGAGFLFVPRPAVARLPPGAWINGEMGEDVAFSATCRAAGVAFEEIRGLRMLHWPIRYAPLAWDTPWDGGGSP